MDTDSQLGKQETCFAHATQVWLSVNHNTSTKEFDVRSVLHGQVSLAAVNQMCAIQEAMNGCKNLKIYYRLASSHTFVEIDHEIISTVILLPSAELFVSYKRKYVHEVLVNCLFKLAQEKVWLSELIVLP